MSFSIMEFWMESLVMGQIAASALGWVVELTVRVICIQLNTRPVCPSSGFYHSPGRALCRASARPAACAHSCLDHSPFPMVCFGFCRTTTRFILDSLNHIRSSLAGLPPAVSSLILVVNATGERRGAHRARCAQRARGAPLVWRR